jgi:phosphoglycerate dehydrogenase-like enzyme
MRDTGSLVRRSNGAFARTFQQLDRDALMKIAILDDYQNVAAQCAGWSELTASAELTFFNDHVSDADALVSRLAPFDIICVMRERTPLSAEIINRLPALKLIASTGPRNASIDVGAARARGIEIVNTGYNSYPTIELTWGLILAGARHIVTEAQSLRAGTWQKSLGAGLHGKTLGILGLGRVGAGVARVGLAFGMKVIAWSHNLTGDKAAEHSVTLATKEELFRNADIVSVHVILSDRTRGLIGRTEIDLMKSSALLVNTSRGPIVDESALIEALRTKRIAGAAVDVFDHEPLPKEHPFRSLPNVLATPHIGYVADDLYRTFYQDTVSNIVSWIAKPRATDPR